MSEAILFTKSLGFTDARAMSSIKSNHRTGATQLTDCLNLTTTPDGCLEKIAPLVTARTHTAPITRISAGTRFLFSDDIDTYEWALTRFVNRFPTIYGPVAHTELDVRVSTGSKVYSSVNSAPAMAEAVVGIYVGAPVPTPFYAQPPFAHAFECNGRLYGVNAAEPWFLQYSNEWSYDLWPLGDCRIDTGSAIMQAGSIPGAQPGAPCVMVTTHATGVSVYFGNGPHDFAEKFYPCRPIDNTLYSGFIDKISGHAHLFLCDDGIYTVTQDGILSNLTAGVVERISSLNSAYTCATVHDGKYLAVGNSVALEYDVQAKTVLKRSPFGINGACIWNGSSYFASGQNIVTPGTEIDTTADFGCSLTLPYSDLGASGAKSVYDLYFTGIIGGDAMITATDNVGKSWSVGVANIGQVTGYRIKTPKGVLGNHISFTVECFNGAFRMEELRAVLAASQRSR